MSYSPSKLDGDLKKKLIKWYTGNVSLYNVEIWTLWKVESETPGKFWCVILKMDGVDQLDRSCEKYYTEARKKETCHV